MSDESDVLARAKRGDQSAFSTLVRSYQRRVFSTALHILGNRGDADDVTQETFVRAYRGMGTFDGRSDFFTWLYRITVNTALNHVRSRKRVAAIATAAEAESDGRPERPGHAEQTPEESLQIDQELRGVLAAVAQLSPTLRVTLILATVQDLPYKQIAEILDIPEGTVAWRVNEARKHLRRLLSGENISDSDT
jgi:RNA polymerase sigma-70 factor (ECF subfamily)